MKQKTLKKIGDGAFFQLTKYSNVKYQMQSKKGGIAVFTSVSSGRTFRRHSSQKCFQ